MSPSGCWEYGSGTGYASLLIDSMRMMAHRLSYLVWVGQPLGMVLHHCDNVRCWRPDHLYDGTALENNQDRRTRALTYGRAGEGNHFSRLTADQVARIRASGDDGVLRRKTAQRLADEYGVSRTTIYRAFTGQTWRDDTRTKPEPRAHWAKRGIRLSR